MYTRMLSLGFVITNLAMIGCGGGSSVEVSIEGKGVVVSNPEGIDCGSGMDSCKYTFSADVESISLLANPPADGSYKFDRWEGACNDSNATCVVKAKAVVTAFFVSKNQTGTEPNEPQGLHVSALDSESFLIQWGAASDQTTTQADLRYNIYFSDKSMGIVSQANLIATVNGSSAKKYSYELDTSALGVGSGSSEYTIAVTALDLEGFESLPIVIGKQKLMKTDPDLAPGIVLVDGAEAGFPQPQITEDDEEIYYRFEGVNSNSVPNMDTFVAYPVSSDGVSYRQLIKVTEVFATGFSGKAVSLSEITSGPVTISGSAVIGEEEENLPASSKSKSEPVKDTDAAEEQLVSPASTSCDKEDVQKLSIAAQKSLEKPVFEYKITLLDNPSCTITPGSPCLADTDFVKLRIKAEPRLLARLNLKGGECYHSQSTPDLFDKDVIEFKKIKGFKFKPGKFRISSKLLYTLDGSASSDVEFENELIVKNLGIDLELRPKKDDTSVDVFTPEPIYLPNNIVTGSVNYTVVITPQINIDFEAVKAIGFEYEGKFSNTFDGVTSAKSISNLTPLDVYFDTYDFSLTSKYTHSLTPVAYIFGFDVIDNNVAFNSDEVPLFSLPSAQGDAKAESFQDNEMCRLIYQFADGANNPLDTEPFSHYLLFQDLSQVSLGKPVSVDKNGSTSKFVYEMSQKDLYEKYVSIAKTQSYKRVARGVSLIGETVVENTEFKKL